MQTADGLKELVYRSSEQTPLVATSEQRGFLGGTLLHRLIHTPLPPEARARINAIQQQIRTEGETAATIITFNEELHFQMSDREWGKRLKALGFEHAERKRATTLMSLMTAGTRAVYEHLQQPGSQAVTLPRLYFAAGLQRRAASYVPNEHAIIVSLDYLRDFARKPDTELHGRHQLTNFLGHKTFDGTALDDWYLMGVEEGDHAHYISTGGELVSDDYKPEWYGSGIELLHDVATVETHWLQTAVELPYVQRDEELHAALSTRLTDATEFMADYRAGVRDVILPSH